MITVAEINDIERLAEFRLLWRAMWGKTRHASFFQSFEWLECYWRRFGEGKRLRTLIVSVAGKPIGIVPLVAKTVPSRIGLVRAVTYPLDSWGPFYGPLGPNPAATLVAAVRHLAESRRNWDMIDMRYVDTAIADRGRTANAMRSAGLQTYQRPWHGVSTVQMEGSTWDQYWAGRTSECRQTYESAVDALSQLGPVSFMRYRPDGAAYGDTARSWHLLDELEQVTAATQSELPTLTNPTSSGDLEFLRDVHAAAVDAGAVDISVLHLNAKPVACAYSYHHDGRVELVRLAARGFVKPAAGVVLLGRMLRNSFERGDRSFTFSQGHLNLKRLWQTATRNSFRYTHFASTAPRAQVLRLSHCVKSWFGDDVATESAACEPVVHPDPANGCEQATPEFAVVS